MGTSPLLADAATAARLDEAIVEAKRTWPAVTVNREGFAAYVEDKLGDDVTLDELNLVDLYLACGCALGVHGAIEAFEQAFRVEIRTAVARMDQRGMSSGDLVQALREKLFTAPPGRRPKITEYGGRGRLRNWVRITVLRMRVDAERVRQAGKEIVASDSPIYTGVPDVTDDPELLHMKQHYREAFAEALPAAFGALTPRQRNLLRGRLVQKLTNDQLSALHQVHKATMKRWIASARETLLKETRAGLERRLGVDRQEFESVMRLIGSRFDVSIEKYLVTQDGSVASGEDAEDAVGSSPSK